MPQVKVENHSSRKLIWAAVVAVASVGLIVAAVIGAMWWLKDTGPDTKVTLNRAADQSFNKNYDASIATLSQQLKAARTDPEKVELYMALGSVYEAKKEPKAALEAYQKAGAILSGYGINEAIARTAAASGNKALALDYYMRNRKLIKAGQSYQHQSELQTIEKKIVELGGKL